MRRMIAEDNRITSREIRAPLDISMTPMKTILHEHLGLRKMCARWIPHKNLKEVEEEEMIQRFNQFPVQSVH